MKVITRLVGPGLFDEAPPNWPEGWPIPRVGDEVTVPRIAHERLVVGTVDWYPEGDHDQPEPFVYLVLVTP